MADELVESRWVELVESRWVELVETLPRPYQSEFDRREFRVGICVRFPSP